MGKRKIEIKKIEDRQKKSVTFTKRRDGLFKKAETACQKFGLQIGIIAFSPAGKPFTFSNSSSSSSVSVDEIIDTYLSSSSSNSSSIVMGKRSSRSDDNDVQVIETEKKKRKTVMNDVVVTDHPPCITVQDEEEEEKSDEGFQWDHYNNFDSDQIYDQEFTNELMGDDGGNSGIVTGEEMTMESSQFLVHSCCWAPPDVELQEIINLDDDIEYADHHHCNETTTICLHPPHLNEEEVGGDKDVELQEIVNLEDFEYADHHHHHPHHEDTTIGLLPPPHTSTTTYTGVCNSMSMSDMNEEEVGGSNVDDYGYTLEEWEHILSTSPTSVVGNSTCMNQEVVQAHWPSQEFLQLLCS